MKVKASLHCHTSADLVEGHLLKYSVFDLIDRAQALGIKVLAHTCHRHFVWDQSWSDYASKCDLLLLPGVELELSEGGSANHTVVINCDASIAKVQNFADLANYRRAHPEALVIAAHPNFGFGVSLGLDRLRQYWDLFDAVEHSWFYSRYFNLNAPVARLAATGSKPFIATADLHNFNFFCLQTDYATLNLRELSSSAVIEAVRQGQFTNHSQSKSLWRLASSIAHALAQEHYHKLTKS